jgi:hypothetical protein
MDYAVVSQGIEFIIDCRENLNCCKEQIVALTISWIVPDRYECLYRWCIFFTGLESICEETTGSNREDSGKCRKFSLLLYAIHEESQLRYRLCVMHTIIVMEWHEISIWLTEKFWVFLKDWLIYWSPLGSSGQSSWLQIQRSEFDSLHYQIFWEVVGLEQGPLSLVSTIEEPLERKSSGYGLESQEYGHRDLSCWPHGTLYHQKLALTTLTSGGHSVGIVRSQTQATEFFLLIYH